MKRSLLLLLPVSAALMGAGCSSSWTTSTTFQPSIGIQGTMPAVPVFADAAPVVAKLASVGDVVFTPEVYSPGTFTMAFKIVGNDGKAYRPETLNVVRDKAVDVVLVRKDMKAFHHETPTFQKNGYWSFKTTIADPGEYWAYLDLSPKVDPPIVWYLPFGVRGKWDNQTPPITPDMKLTVDGVQAALHFDKTPKAGEQVIADFGLTKDGQAVTDIKPYMAAYGNLVALLYKSPDTYVPSHPFATTLPTNGHEQFALTFPEVGIYTLFAQFNIGGKVETFPVTVEVK